MFNRLITALSVTVALASTSALATPVNLGASIENATAACMQANPAAVEVAGTVEDGMGDLIVWLKDKEGGLWLCDASMQGAVFASVRMEGDLLQGTGAELIGIQQVSGRNSSRAGAGDPSVTAQTLCSTIGGMIEQMTIVATVADGMGDYLVWLKNANEQLWMCNASADAKLYTFAPVDLPINEFEPVVLRNA
jgi:hypothetical protein